MNSRTQSNPALVAEAIPPPKVSLTRTQGNKITMCITALLMFGVITIGGICGSGKCSILSEQSRDSVIANTPMPSAVQIRRRFPSSAPSHYRSSCGDGKIGNGICAKSSLCCSKFGYCGSTDAYCADPELPCGDGTIGNGSCAIKALCCSNYGYCGSTNEYCGDDTIVRCGDGRIGNGICTIANLCCSKFGYCGSTDAYCVNSELPCGNGQVGSGICAHAELCCSIHGYCGSTIEYCVGAPTPTSVSIPSPSFN